ncbi:MAG: hypothetical protein C4K60_02995 [Ideonella sp. MAG2]|nr:MAG: hypothetical protein C4K60_02995 [Ideonella sp. MAG2]
MLSRLCPHATTTKLIAEIAACRLLSAMVQMAQRPRHFRLIPPHRDAQIRRARDRALSIGEVVGDEHDGPAAIGVNKRMDEL